ncbi:hypothetical protein [Effusibacillus consociatus]|uniref:Uncharacterized protein n=1 Tax=Effusibacillus consociatus TaxID=1117041 RepID=A0ABV9Q516_9BACL
MSSGRFLKNGMVSVAALIIALVWSHKASAAVFTSPEGIQFSSQSSAWNSEERLKQVYAELLKNTHGEEFKLLAEVRIHDGYPKGKSVAGEYQFKTSVDLLGRQKMLPGSIDLYGGGERTTIESIAKTLSHEYGHHVTHYYSIKQDGFSITDKQRWRQTTYAKIRGLANDPRINQSDEHRWQLAEIAAEDYVQLFGSPTAKKVHVFPSRYELLQKKQEIGPLRWDASMYNVAPQENMELPLASKVPKLYQWLAQHLGVAGQPLFPEDPSLKIREVIKEGQAGYQIRFEWTGGKNSSKTYYTLVAYGENDSLPEPVVTRKAGEPLEARYGTMVVRTPTSILTYRDPNAAGIRHFRVYAQNEAGFVVSSPILMLDMNQPTKVTITEQTVQPSQQVDSQAVEVNEAAPNLFELSGWQDVLLRGITLIVEVISRFLEILFNLAS